MRSSVEAIADVGGGGGEGFLREAPFGLGREGTAERAISSAMGFVVGGEVTTHVLKILAAERIIEGPPMSIFLDELFKAYKMTAVLSSKARDDYHHVDGWNVMFGYSGAMGGVLGGAGCPRWTLGLQGLHSAVEHLGKSGGSEMFFTTMPIRGEALRVPPVETSSTPIPASLRAKIYQSGFVGDAENGTLDFGH